MQSFQHYLYLMYSALFVEKNAMDNMFLKGQMYICVLDTCQSEMCHGFFPTPVNKFVFGYLQ